jgi:hypothetical protein
VDFKYLMPVAALEAKASGETALEIQKKGKREESVIRVTPRPHGAWDIVEPHKPDQWLDGDYLTSRGQYLDSESDDPADAPLATVTADELADQISVELRIEIQPRDLRFTQLLAVDEKPSSGWFQRKAINSQAIAKRLVELTHSDPATAPQLLGQLRVPLGTTTLRGVRRKRRGES